MSEQALMSPTVPTQVGNVPVATGGGGGGGGLSRKLLLRKTVDYHASALHFLESRLWQRDRRDVPLIQPDSSYYNVVTLPHGLTTSKVNVVTTKFVKACTNKTRSPIFTTAWVPDGRRLITGAASGEFTLWNGINFNFESIIQAHDCSVRSINWSHNGKWMVTSDDRGFIKYWQINFNNVHTFQAHSEPVRSSSFSPTDTKLATCSDDGTVRVFDFLCCTEEHILRGHGADVKCVHWHPRKCLLASGSKDNQQPVKLWDPKSGQSVCTIHAHKATVMDIKWNKNGNWLATASRDFLIKLYDVRAMKELAILKGHKKDVNTLSWHPVYENVFSSGGSDGAVLFWMVGNDREIGGMESAHEGFVWSLSWHPLGHLLCSGANDHTCKFWCRNRPGEELKDKYNTFHNPFYMGDEPDINLPGPDISRGHAPLMPPPTDAITLPPPPTTLPWRQNSSNEIPAGLNAPRIDVPVLGADIIAETFSGGGGGRGEIQNGRMEDDFPNPHPEHNSNNIRPLLDEHPPPHSYPREDWGRPTGPFGGPHPHHDDFGGNRYSWHRYQPRRPSLDEERWNHNPFVYRRSEGHPPPRMDGPPQGPRDEFGNYHEDQFGRRDYHPPPPERPYSGPPPGERPYGAGERPFGGPPPGERSFGGPPPGERPYGGPPPPGERQFGGPPQGERQFRGPPPQEDRQFGGPPPGDRQFHSGDRQFSGPPPMDDRKFVGGPPPMGEDKFGGAPGGEGRDFNSDERRPPLLGGGERRSQFHPQDPRQQPPPPDQWRGPHPPARGGEMDGNYPPQDPRQQHSNYPPLDPRQDPRSFRSQHPPPFGHNSAPINYRPPDTFHHDRHHQYDDGFPPGRGDPYPHGDEMGKPEGGPPARDPRFERRGGWRDGDSGRRRDDYSDRDRRRGDGRGGGRGRDDEVPPRHRNSDDRDSPSTKRSKRDSSNDAGSSSSRSSSSSRGHSKNNKK